MDKCIKCNGKVIQRTEFNGVENYCVNCGFDQVPTITPDKALAKDSLDHQRRNRSMGWSPTYVHLRDPYQLRKDRGQISVKTEYNRRKARERKQLAVSFYGEE